MALCCSLLIAARRVCLLQTWARTRTPRQSGCVKYSRLGVKQFADLTSPYFTGPGHASSAQGGPHPPASPAPASAASLSPGRGVHWNPNTSHGSRLASAGPAWGTRTGTAALTSRSSPSHTLNPKSRELCSERMACLPSPPNATAPDPTPRPSTSPKAAPRPSSAPSQPHAISIDASLHLSGTLGHPNIPSQGVTGTGRAAFGRKLRSKVRKRPLHNGL